MFIDLISIAILKIDGVDFCYIINGINKSKAINLLKHADLSKKVDHYKI